MIQDVKFSYSDSAEEPGDRADKARRYSTFGVAAYFGSTTFYHGR